MSGSNGRKRGWRRWTAHRTDAIGRDRARPCLLWAAGGKGQSELTRATVRRARLRGSFRRDQPLRASSLYGPDCCSSPTCLSPPLKCRALSASRVPSARRCGAWPRPPHPSRTSRRHSTTGRRWTTLLRIEYPTALFWETRKRTYCGLCLLLRLSR